MKNYLTEEQKRFIIKNQNICYSIGDYQSSERSLFDFDLKPTNDSLYVCSCDNGFGKPQTRRICKYCGNYFKTIDLHLFSNKLGEPQLYVPGVNVSGGTHCLFVEENKDEDNSILAHHCAFVAVYDKETHLLKPDLQVLETCILSAGKGVNVFEYVNGEPKEIKPLDFLVNLYQDEKCFYVYDNCVNVIEFIDKDVSFSDRTGLKDFTYQTSNLDGKGRPYSPDGYFFLYMFVACLIPSVERISKMRCGGFIDSFLKSVYFGQDKYLKQRFNEFNKIVFKDASKGNSSFTLPLFVIKFLIKKKSTFYNYLVFLDMFKYDESLNKDTFFKFVGCEEFVCIFDDLDNPFIYPYGNFTALMRRGYKAIELCKYLGKQADRYCGRETLQSMFDYVRMGEQLGIEVQKFPKSLKQAHDSLSAQFKAYEHKKDDPLIYKASSRFKPLVIDLNKKSPKYCIRMPKCSLDLIREGQEQHNCVGSYIDAVKKKHSVVFFIRKKDDKERSFVTAEYKYGGLHQIFYSNNRSVDDKEVLDFANQFVSQAKNYC